MLTNKIFNASALILEDNREKESVTFDVIDG